MDLYVVCKIKYLKLIIFFSQFLCISRNTLKLKIYFTTKTETYLIILIFLSLIDILAELQT